MFYPDYEAKMMQAFVTNDKYRAKLPPTQVKLMAAKAEAGETKEVQKYCALSATGNIMVSSTSAEEDKIDPEVKELFKKTAVFFAATTAALNQKEKTLYDYDAIHSIIGDSGLFVSVHEEDRTFDYVDTKVEIDTAIIQAVLGAVVPGIGAGAAAMSIAKSVLGHMGETIKVSASAQKATQKVGHLLFVCENLMGMPLVSASLFYIDKEQGKIATKSNCHSSSSELFRFKFHQHTYMFVDPEYIVKYAGKLDVESPEYKALVDKLAGSIK